MESFPSQGTQTQNSSARPERQTEFINRDNIRIQVQEGNGTVPVNLKGYFTNKELKRKEDEKEKRERYAAREKCRKDTEIYRDMCYNWEEIMKEKENRLKREEQERNSRIDKSNSLKGIWELMRTCKEYLAEWEIDWRVGNEKN